MPDSERLQRLAHLEKDCPDCRGEGFVQWPHSGFSLAHGYERHQCLACKDGKVFVFGDMVRVKCQHKHGTTKTWIIKEQRYVWKCIDCQGLGTVASQALAVWVKAAQGAFKDGPAMVSCYFNEISQRYTRFIWRVGGYAGPDDPDPLTALAMALEKAVGKET
ncbi:hypothetical protein LCGC14_2668890 [marine sediment metagenome]|uniref:Uncharacterized protein n=1 Tax=marine sediment metagenome TaxID=412755 RepID=A0A0F9CGJ0_9ZZZZ